MLTSACGQGIAAWRLLWIVSSKEKCWRALLSSLSELSSRHWKRQIQEALHFLAG